MCTNAGGLILIFVTNCILFENIYYHTQSDKFHNYLTLQTNVIVNIKLAGLFYIEGEFS